MNSSITSRRWRAKAEWIVREALRSKPRGGWEVGKDDGGFLLTQRSYGSRTFTGNYLRFEAVILSSHVKGGIKRNFSHLTLLSRAARQCLIWWEMWGVWQAVGGWRPGPSTTTAPWKCWWHPGCEVLRQGGHRSWFLCWHPPWSWHRRALQKLQL